MPLCADISLMAAVPYVSTNNINTRRLSAPNMHDLNCDLSDLLGLGGDSAISSPNHNNMMDPTQHNLDPNFVEDDQTRQQQISQVALRLRSIGDELERDVGISRYLRRIQNAVLGESTMDVLLQLFSIVCLGPETYRRIQNLNNYSASSSSSRSQSWIRPHHRSRQRTYTI